ncbi:MAG: hypothetical protein AAF066_02325 [Pseudomonadota bacterium]
MFESRLLRTLTKTPLIDPNEVLDEEWRETRHTSQRRVALLVAFDQPDEEATLDRVKGLKRLIGCVLAEASGDPDCAQARQCLDELLEDWSVDHFNRIIVTLYSDAGYEALLADLGWLEAKLLANIIAEKSLLGI